MKPIHKAICAGTVGALLAFTIAKMVWSSGSAFVERDGMVFIVCGPQVEDFRPWYCAFFGYVLAFTPVLIFADARPRCP
jgi:hypothetical protein